MATQAVTIGDVCTELVQWWTFRCDGLNPGEVAELMRLSSATARHYERTLAQLGATPKTSAAPGQARPRTADNTSE